MKTEFILENGSGNINEDNIILEKNLFGVFDGATSLNNITFDHGKTGGLIASSTARAVFAKNCHPLLKLAKVANREIFNQMFNYGVDFSKKENLWSTSASVIRIENNKLEWVQTGDSFIILIYKNNSYKVLVKQDDHDHETLTMWKKAAKTTSFATGKIKLFEILMDQIKKTRAGMNKTYGVLNGEKKAENFINHGYESLDQVEKILLFTDGLSIPNKIPEKSKNFGTLVDYYLSFGLNGLKNKIREMEKKDPDCTIYPRFKCHDDIAAIAISNFLK